MNKRVYILLAFIICSLLTGCSAPGRCEQTSSAENYLRGDNEEQENRSLRDDPLWSDDESLRAMVISDLHYTEYKDVNHSLVPGIGAAEEITDVIVAEVIDRHPDVFIMTGDNTDSGDAEDVAGLFSKLQKIRDKGISIILTTGNHDYDLMDAGEIEKAYFGLLEPADRDPASLSYTAVVKDVVFLAMDDNAVYPGGRGEFSPETMGWIEDMLEKYREHSVIFLSHHNVLYGFGEENTGSNLIQNPDLPSLLSEGGVKLAFTGHMHMQYITEKDGMWEVLSGMPFSGKHLVGNLAVGKDRMLYYSEPIDFAAYSSSVSEEVSRLDKESSAYMDRIFSGILEQEGLYGSKKDRVLELIERFFLYYGNGTLAEHTGEIKDDPSYESMIKALWSYNYGKWMQEMIETTKYNATELTVTGS